MGTHGLLSPFSLLPIAIVIVLLLAVALIQFLRSRTAMAMFAGKSARTEPLPAPVHDITAPESGYEAGERQTAVFAGGCFWGVQSVFQRVHGVETTVVGYSGGSKHTAIYRAVSSMNTGHAEAIKVVFNPAVVTYGTLLRVFFSVVHDPTQLNRQGADVGTQYRSSIFFTTPAQERIAREYIAQLDAAGIFNAPIVTEVTPLVEFFDGEDYHQDYALKNPDNPYIQVCDIPKIGKLQQQFPDLFQDYTLPGR